MTDTTTTTIGPSLTTAPHDTVRLEFPRGARRLTLQVDAGLPTLYRARFDGPRPAVHEANGTITIDYPRLGTPGRMGLGRRAAEITLSPRGAWALALGGVARMRADLRGLELRSLEVSGGASDLDLALPAPRGVVPVWIGGGARVVALRLPAGSAARLRIGGGASRVTFDDQYLGAVGGGIRLTTDDAGGASDRYEIEVGGGASRLTVTVGETTPSRVA